jgi:CHAT domain-containing protein
MQLPNKPHVFNGPGFGKIRHPLHLETGDTVLPQWSKTINQGAVTVKRAFFKSLVRKFSIAMTLCSALLALPGAVWALAATESIEATINQVQALSKEGNHFAAAALGENWFAHYSKEPVANSADGARLWTAIADVYCDARHWEKCVQPLLHAVAISEKIHGRENPETVVILVKLSLAYHTLGLYEKALPLQLRILSVVEKTLGPDHPTTVIALNNLAEIYSALAQYDKVLSLQKRALSTYEKILGPEHSDTGNGLNNISGTYADMAMYDLALPLQQRALTISEKVHGPEHPDTALCLNNLAEIYSALAQYGEALPLQQRALAIREKVLGPEHSATALSLNNLAQTYSALAQYDKALPLHQRALSIYEKRLGAEHPDTARSLNNLALVYFNLGRYDLALPLQQRALTISEKVHGTEHPNTARILGNLAQTYRALAQYENALPLQQRALAIYEKVLGPEHPDTARGLNNLAQTYKKFALYDQALKIQLRAMEISETALGPEHPDTALYWSNLAGILEYMDQPELVVSFLKRSVNIYQAQREKIGVIGNAELHSYTASVQGNYQALASLLTDQGRLTEAQQVLDMLKEVETFEFIQRSASSDPRHTLTGYTATEKVWMDRYQKISEQLVAIGIEERAIAKAAKFGLSAKQHARQKILQSDLIVARKAFDRYMKDIQSEFATKGAARSVEVVETSVQATRDLQTLIRSLGEDVVLLQYYMTDNQVNMLLTTPDLQKARSAKVDTKELNRQIAALGGTLRDRKSDPLPLAQALYRLLLAPVEADLAQAGTKVVMLSLDGALRYLPFGALHDGKHYAAEKWNLPIYTSVVRDKLRDAAVPQWTAAGLGLTRAVGEFAPLPAVRAEMDSIVKTRGDAGTGVVPGEVYLDEAFTASRLKDVGQRKFELLHVASHFRFSPGTEANSFLVLGDGQQLTLGDLRTQNYRFDYVDLLTLSACETGLGGGRDEKGKEIEGFGVLAQQQGAKAVLATLWPVADRSTATLMADMYRRRQAHGLSKIEALRQAQLALMNHPKYMHPFYWAPFVLMGNWK